MIERLRVILGTLLLTAAVGGFVVVPEHKPISSQAATVSDIEHALSGHTAPMTWHLSPTLYDVLRIATWALLIVGGVVLLSALRTTKAPARGRGPGQTDL